MSALGMGGALRRGASSEWYTPPHVFDALGLQFDLDPCAPRGGVSWIPAEKHYCLGDDGLSRRWFGSVWCNPPYGRETAAWVERLVDHGNGVALVFARVDTAWGQRALHAASAVCLIAGRLSFVDGHGGPRKGHNAAAPSMLLGFGAICARAVRECGLGWTVAAPSLSGRGAA